MQPLPTPTCTECTPWPARCRSSLQSCFHCQTVLCDCVGRWLYGPSFRFQSLPLRFRGSLSVSGLLRMLQSVQAIWQLTRPALFSSTWWVVLYFGICLFTYSNEQELIRSGCKPQGLLLTLTTSAITRRLISYAGNGATQRMKRIRTWCSRRKVLMASNSAVLQHPGKTQACSLHRLIGDFCHRLLSSSMPGWVVLHQSSIKWLPPIMTGLCTQFFSGTSWRECRRKWRRQERGLWLMMKKTKKRTSA